MRGARGWQARKDKDTDAQAERLTDQEEPHQVPKIRIVVAGAGIIGLFLAECLAARGARVTVVDACAPGSGATAGSFGWVNASFAETDAYFALRAEAVAAWHRSGLGPAQGVRMGGSLWWEEEGEDFDTQARTLSRRGWQAEVVGRAQIATLEPALKTPPARAIHAPREGAVDSAPLTGALCDRLRELGAKLVIGPRITGLVRRGSAVTGIATDRGEFAADRVVLALGGGMAAMSSETGIKVTERAGLIVHTSPVSPCLNGVLMTPGIHMRQACSGAFLIGEIFSGDGPDPDRTERDPLGLAQEMMARLADRIPAAGSARVARVMAARRPVPADGLPVVGQLAPGAWVATMHSGVTLAPLVAARLAEEILSGGEDPLLAPFRPGRPGLA